MRRDSMTGQEGRQTKRLRTNYPTGNTKPPLIQSPLSVFPSRKRDEPSSDLFYSSRQPSWKVEPPSQPTGPTRASPHALPLVLAHA